MFYLDEGRGGGALMHVYVYIRTHNQPFYKTTLWMFTKLDRDEVLIDHAPVYRKFWQTPPRGGSRAGQFAKNRSMRGSFS